jgi:hypothetical protein
VSKPPPATVTPGATSAASTGERPAASPPPKPNATATTAGAVVNVAPLAPQPAPVAVPPAKNCNPNYYFDKDGRKHFKPECF